MIGYYNYTVWLTYIGMISGVSGLGFAATGHPFVAVLCLLFSGFCDLFDGRVARTKKDRTEEERRYGIQIDSLSDLVCFGVLPTAIGYAAGLRGFYWLPLFCVYTLAALIRLGYYNVTEETRQKESEEVRKFYLGLPVTSAAIIFPFFYGLYFFIPAISIYVYAVVLAMTAILFVAPIRVAKPHKTGIYALIALGAAIAAFLIVMRIFWWK